MDDPFDLQRFVEAQDPVMDQVRAELGRGRKTSHWMWFIFPQIAGLGFSAMAQRYAIRSLDEAAAYLAHQVLGPRLLECTRMVNAVVDAPIDRIFGSPDDVKFHACMTLFEMVGGEGSELGEALERYFGGVRHEGTLALVGRR